MQITSSVLVSVCLLGVSGCGATGGEAQLGAGTSDGDGGNRGFGNPPGESLDGGLLCDDAAAGGDGNTGLGDDRCVGVFAEATREPAIFQTLIDTSGSMDFEAPGGDTRWEVTQFALEAALNDLAVLAPETVVGLSFFPNLGKTWGSDCYFPEQTVGMNPLTPAHLELLMSGLGAVGIPIGGTPTHNAYYFSVGQLKQYAFPGERYMLLITDGNASYGMTDRNNPGANCSGPGKGSVSQPELDALIQEVSEAYTIEGIRTFVIGVPGSGDPRDDFRPVLSEMARAGGTGAVGCNTGSEPYCHFDMTTQPDLGESLGGALALIRGRALSCAYTIPEPPDGKQVNFSEVNVVYTAPGADAERLAPNEDGCVDGWWYSPDKTQVLLCGPTCDRVKEQGGSIDIEFGCFTVPA